MVQNNSLLEKPGLISRVIKTELVNWREFKFIQQPNFKDIEPEAVHKLKASILQNNFAQPFYVWEDADGVLFCLDGKHRTLMLEELLKEGHEVPYLLPATFIHCDNKKEAAKLVTIYSSIYARVNQQGLFDFLTEYEIDFSDIKDHIDLPDFSTEKFEQKFDLHDIKTLDEMEADSEDHTVSDSELLVKPGDIFSLGNHIVMCHSFLDDIVSKTIISEGKARILLTDPPYNLPASTIVSIDRHENFAMAHGEMTNEEFVDFLASIMQMARLTSVDGSIHYIFMDFRHAWHMTEAGRKVYGSPEPKQLCVWTKDIMANGSFYRAKHELCFIFKSGEAKHLSNINLHERIRSNVWTYPSANSLSNPDKDQLKNHPTPKPVSMLADAILDTTDEGEIVTDFFLGSGATLIACEQTKRRCIGSEIEPKYVQSIIRRYVAFCKKAGNTPEVVHLNGNLRLMDICKSENDK